MRKRSRSLVEEICIKFGRSLSLTIMTARLPNGSNLEDESVAAMDCSWAKLAEMVCDLFETEGIFNGK